jgi:hypothetical protein
MLMEKRIFIWGYVVETKPFVAQIRDVWNLVLTIWRSVKVAGSG